MFGSVGVPELLIILVVGVLCLLPIVAGIWGLVMLIRILSNQQSINARLDALERHGSDSRGSAPR
jgi:hypothetical protein